MLHQLRQHAAMIQVRVGQEYSGDTCGLERKHAVRAINQLVALGSSAVNEVIALAMHEQRARTSDGADRTNKANFHGAFLSLGCGHHGFVGFAEVAEPKAHTHALVSAIAASRKARL